MTSAKVLELTDNFSQDDIATWVTQSWDKFNRQRQEQINSWEEISRYVFATDTRSTTNAKLPWKNSTTLPKLTQIRDNLHANYSAALFPNDKWIKWEGHSREDASKKKASAITAYMDNKTREGGLLQVADKLLLDYIDKGNCFAMPAWEYRYTEKGGERITSFMGPKAVRIDPMDIVFNPTAASFKDTWKIVRSIKSTGELLKLARMYPEQAFWEDVVRNRMDKRKILAGYSYEDVTKANLYSVDGFGNLYEYYMSDFVEVLEFYGDYHNHETGVLEENQMITVVDRAMMVRQMPSPTYDGSIPIFHAGWRTRPGNLWSQGPLENLVGMQYRIDHLENLKADAMDLIVHPPLKIIGDVDPFEWGPGCHIHIDGEGDVQEVSKGIQNIVIADNQIELLENKMELYAGAPREAAGVRSPGEKTAFEVQQLENAAGRIFQVKIVHFEVEMLEKLLNGMLETAHRHFGDSDIIRTIDGDLGVVGFETITKEDITARGILRPIGARNFAQKAQDLQNLTGVLNSPIGQLLQPHTSSINLAKYIEDTLNIRAYEIFRPNVQVQENKDTAALADQAQNDMAMQQTVAQEFPEQGTIV